MRSRLRFVVCAGLLAALAAARPVTAASEHFVFGIDALQVVPPTSSSAIGSASLDLDLPTGTLSGYITIQGLSSAVTSVQIHGPGARGDVAPMVYDLVRSMHVLIGPIPHLQLRDLRQELWYLEVRTGLFLNGEVRGQIVHESAVQGATWAALKLLYRR